MSIRITQLNRLASQVIETSLQGGTFPTVQTVIAGIASLLGESAPGTPTLHELHLGGVTDPVALSTMVNELYGDMTDLYSEVVDQVNRLALVFDQTYSLQANLRTQLLGLENSVTLSLPGSTSVSQVRVNGYQSVDSNSTAWINPRSFSATLPELPGRSTPILPSKVSVTPGGKVGFSLGSPHDITTSMSNTGYLVRVIGHGSGHTLTIHLTYEHPKVGNEVRLVFASSNALTATLLVNGAEIATRNAGFGNELNWTFPARYVRTVELKLYKPKPDAGTSYDYAIRQVSLISTGYQSQAAVTFYPLALGPIGTLVLSPNTDQQPGTQIQWQVGFNGPSGAFIGITPKTPTVINKPVIVDNLQTLPVRRANGFAIVHNRINDKTTSLTNGDLVTLSPRLAARAPLFNLCRVSPRISRGMSYVRRGRNAWNVMSYHYNLDGPGVSNDPFPTLRDFQELRGTNPTPTILQRYQPTEMYISTQFPGVTGVLQRALRLPAIEVADDSVRDRTMHLFQASLYLDPTLDPTVLTGFNRLTLNFPHIFASRRAALYVNHTAVTVNAVTFGTNLTYQAVLPLVPGDNLIQIVTNNYSALAGSPFDIGTGTTVAGGTGILTPYVVDGGPITWYADPGPMTEVTLFELSQQTARGDQSRYALAPDTTTGQQVILLRDLPATCYDVMTQAFPAGTGSTTVQALLIGGTDPSVTPAVYGFNITNQTVFDKTQLLRQSSITLGVPV
jgi:hypothetical protein